MESLEQVKFKVGRLKLHFFYNVVILIAIIILLATQNWTSIEKFTDYLTAAGTMVSIVLGVLAIIYSFVSGDSMSKSLGNVSAAALDLQTARQEFANVVHAASDLSDTSRASSSELNGLLEILKLEVKELKEASKNISESNEGIAKTIGLMPERLDKIDNRLEESLKGTKKESSFGHGSGDQVLARKMVKDASPVGTAFLYASSISKEKNINFSLEAAPFGAGEYTYGFMLASYAAGVLDFEHVDEENRIVTITEFALSSSEVFDLAQQYVNANKEDGKYLSGLLAKVNKLFDVRNPTPAGSRA